MIHMAGPPNANDRATSTVPTLAATAPTTRRPRVSASRPPTTIPMLAGVDVSTMNTEIMSALMPRSSRRYSVRNCDCGPPKTLRRNQVTATSTSRR